jgi:LPXTG-motif cell wall-anchored protein
MDNTVWIVIAVIAALVLIAGLLVGRRRRDVHRHAEAEEIREHLRLDEAEVRHRGSLAAETEALARSARAQADAKAAEAERLHSAAESYRGEVSASLEKLDQQRQRAEALDPLPSEPAPRSGRPGS